MLSFWCQLFFQNFFAVHWNRVPFSVLCIRCWPRILLQISKHIHPTHWVVLHWLLVEVQYFSLMHLRIWLCFILQRRILHFLILHPMIVSTHYLLLHFYLRDVLWKLLGFTFNMGWCFRLIEDHNQQIEAREMYNSETHFYPGRSGGCYCFWELSHRGTRRWRKWSHQCHRFYFLSGGNHTERIGIHEVK